MTAARPLREDLPLFAPDAIGIDAETWDELDDSDAPEDRPKCSECDHPLRSAESIDAGIGPCCAAKIGRAVAQRRKSERERMTS